MIFIRRVGSKPQRIGSRDLQKSGLKTKKLFQKLFQRWCLISTFNCPCFCNSFFAPSSRGRPCLAAGRGCGCSVLWQRLPLARWDVLGACAWAHRASLAHGVRPWPSVTIVCSRQRWPAPHREPGRRLGRGHLHRAPHSQTSHPTTLSAGVAPTWSSLCGTRLPKFLFGCTIGGRDTSIGGMTSSHPTLAGDSSASGIPMALLGD